MPLPGLVEVTNLANGRSVVVRVNDRGPFVDGRIIDLSRGAADALGMLQRGVGEVRVRYLGPAPRLGSAQPMQYAAAVAPAPAPPRPQPAAETGRYWIQAGSFADRRAARRAADRLGDRATVDVAGQGDFGSVPRPRRSLARSERRRARPSGRGRARLRRRPVDIGPVKLAPQAGAAIVRR